MVDMLLQLHVEYGILGFCIGRYVKDIIDHEDKKHPLSDIALQREMKARGYDLARRTIAKYRDQMGIPKAILRKE